MEAKRFPPFELRRETTKSQPSEYWIPIPLVQNLFSPIIDSVDKSEKSRLNRANPDGFYQHLSQFDKFSLFPFFNCPIFKILYPSDLTKSLKIEGKIIENTAQNHEKLVSHS